MRTHAHRCGPLVPLLLVGLALNGCDQALEPGHVFDARPGAAAPVLARGPGGAVMVPISLREWIEPADDAVPLLCVGGLQVDKNHWIGTAVVSHLGRSAIDFRIESCRTELVPVEGHLLLWTAEVVSSYTAANGDELWIIGELRSYEPSRIETDFTITGGTGRFAGATGFMTGLGARAADAYVAYNEGEGMISRPNSTR